MKKSASYFLVLNLFLSIVAFSFILNIGVVSGEDVVAVLGGTCKQFDSDISSGLICESGRWVNSPGLSTNSNAGGGIVGAASLGETLFSQKKPPVATTPVTPPSWYENILGYGEKDAAIKAGVTKADANQMTFAQGDFVDGIVSSAAWAGIVYGAVQFIAPMAGANSDQTNAISTAMGVGTFTGKN